MTPPESPNSTPPDPSILFDTLNAHQRSAALRGAIDLNLFSSIARGYRTAGDLATACQASARGTRILCDYLVVIGLLTRSGQEYGLTPAAAAFLDRQSPQYLGSMARFMNSPDLLNAFRDVAELVRRGTTLMERGGTTREQYEGWVEFARSMAPLMAPTAGAIAELVGGEGPLRVLDVAAGHGLFGIAIARRNPQAEIVALDWPQVLAVAQENATAGNVQDRYTLLGGDALQADYGAGYDLALVTNFFHHFDQSTCESVMRKLHAALRPGGRVVTLEFLPNEDRVSPAVAATFSMMMLGTTPAGDAYTFNEFNEMFRNAGFARSEFIPLPESPQDLVVSYR